MSSSRLNILIFGAGAIGCFVGGHLAAAGQRVTLLGRASLMDQVRAEGLTIQWPEQALLKSKPETVTTPDDLSPPYDFILVTAKSPATPQIIAQLQAYPNLLEQAYLVSLQNGIGNEEQLAAAFGREKDHRRDRDDTRFRFRPPVTLRLVRPKAGLGLAPLAIEQPVERLAEALTQAGLSTPVYADYQAMKWSKLLLNIVNNATSAILDLPPVRDYRRPRPI